MFVCVYMLCIVCAHAHVCVHVKCDVCFVYVLCGESVYMCMFLCVCVCAYLCVVYV